MSVASSAAFQKTRTWRLSSVGIGSASCKRASLRATTHLPFKPHRGATAIVDLGLTRSGGISLLQRALSSRLLRFRGRRRAATALRGRRRCASQTTSALGGELPGQFREPRGTGRRGACSHRRPRHGRDAALRTGHPLAPGQRFYSPGGAHLRTDRTASRRPRIFTLGMPGTATHVGGPMARCGSLRSCIRGSGSKRVRDNFQWTWGIWKVSGVNCPPRIQFAPQ